MSEAYDDYLQSNHWMAVKEAMYARYKCCQLCKKTDTLNVHHLTYSTKGNENLGTDVVQLCHKCHKRCHFTFTGRKIPLTENELRKRYKHLMQTRLIRNFRLGSALNSVCSYLVRGLMA